MLNRFSQPIDRIALVVIAILSVLIGLLVLTGDHTSPRVRDFSWHDRQVGAEDRAFIMTFSRPMNHESVEQNLQIEPPLAGKFSWAGRRMAYTLDAPAPYGTSFQVKLQGASDRFSSVENQRPIQPFEAQFRTRDRAFVYLGVEGQEAGRLVLQNLSTKTHTILTPANLTVMDFEPYPEGDRVLFSASDRNAQGQNLLDQQLYSVTTGIQPVSQAQSPAELKAGEESDRPATAQPAGIMNLVLDSKEYQNLQFDLSPDGETVIVRRINRQTPTNDLLWIVRSGQSPQPLKTEPGGNFLIAPDSRSLALAQGEGIAILPFQSDAQPLDFLPKFGMVLNFAKDGTAAAMVQFNADPNNPTRSLYLVTNQGTQKELFKVTGSILSAQFDSMKKNLYVLATELLPGNEYIEQPYLTAIDLKTDKRTDLLLLPIQRDIQISLAPDTLGLLFDQVVSDPDPTATGVIQGSDGKAIASSQLWFLPIVFDNTGAIAKSQPEALALPGLRPRWLP